MVPMIHGDFCRLPSHVCAPIAGCTFLSIFWLCSSSANNFMDSMRRIVGSSTMISLSRSIDFIDIFHGRPYCNTRNLRVPERSLISGFQLCSSAASCFWQIGNFHGLVCCKVDLTLCDLRISQLRCCTSLRALPSYVASWSLALTAPLVTNFISSKII